MYLYIIFTLIAILALGDVFIKQENRGVKYKLVFFGIIFMLFCFSALRVERGTDWWNYEKYFLFCTDWYADGWMEPGFTLFNKVVGVFTSNYSVLVFITSGFVFLVKPNIIYKLSAYPFVALFCWFAINMADLFPVRQTIALTFLMASFPFIINRRIYPFLILLALATTMHLTSIIFLVAYFAFNFKINRLFLLIIFGGSFVFAIVLSSVMSNLLSAISNPFIAERINDYLSTGTDENYGSAYSASQVIIRGFINRGMIMFLIIVLLGKYIEQDKVFRGWVNLFVLGSIIFAMMSSVSPALGRLSAAFDVAQIFIFPYIFKLKMTHFSRLLIFLVMALYFVYRFYGVVNNYYDLYVPYKSLFWNTDLIVS